MTVENMFRLMATHPPPQLSGHSGPIASMATKSIQIPSMRKRHPSLGSTGSYDGGSSTSGSPPLQDLMALQMSQHFAMPTSPKSGKQLDQQLSQEGSQKSVNPTRYKTELCRPYEESGYCKYGEKCQFAHGVHEIRSLSRHPKYKTELCRTYHTVGFCPYGPRCHFIHNEDELKLCQINQQKQQQILQQMAQVVHQQALNKLSGKDLLSLPSLYYQNHSLQQAQALDLCFPVLPPSVDTPPPSVTDCSPSLSPSSVFSQDEMFSRIATPPPGFTLPPPALPKLQNATTSNFTSLEAAIHHQTEGDVPRSTTPPRPKMGLASLPRTESWQCWQSPSILSSDLACF